MGCGTSSAISFPGRLPCPHGRGGGRVRLRRRRPGASPTRWCAAIRMCSADASRRRPASRPRDWGAGEGGRSASRRRARSTGWPSGSGADPGGQAAGPGRPRRVRLAGCGAVLEKIAEETARLVRRRRPRRRAGLRGVQRPHVRHGEPRPPPPRRSRGRAAAANAKFARRFEAIEAALAPEGRTPARSDLAEMDAPGRRNARRKAALSAGYRCRFPVVFPVAFP